MRHSTWEENDGNGPSYGDKVVSRKQIVRIAELEEQLKQALILMAKMVTDVDPEQVMETYDAITKFVQQDFKFEKWEH